MLKIFDFVLGNWKMVLVLALISLLGIQSYRLRGALGEIKVFKEREAAQIRDQQRRELANLRNKERTDEEYFSARRRAASVVVRIDKPAAIIAHREAPVTRSGDESAICFGRGDFDDALADFSQRHAERLNRFIADVSQRLDAGASVIARVEEELAAAYRACRTFAVDVE